ncbi:MAG: WG repeat-containing protein [Neisseriaceae bacterium]|nr:WG repeat-containing protein [Neisseriaceae bacterium]
MKKFITLVASLYLISAIANADCIRPKAPYKKINCLQEGLSVVLKDGKYGAIDANGKEVIPLKYDFIAGFSEGLSHAKKANKKGYINKQGEEIIPFEYDFAENFENGIAKVNKDEKWFYIDKSGKFVKDVEK